MAFVPVPNCILIEIRGRKAGQLVENRFYVSVGHVPTFSDFQALALIVFTRLRSDWLPFLPLDFTLTEVFFRSMETANSQQISVAAAVTDVGGHIGAPAANQNTICISLRSASAGRSARGRLYWLGLSEDQYTTNTMNAGELASIVEAVRLLRTDLATAQMPWVIVSFVANGVPRPGGPIIFSVETVIAVDDVVDSQRRRMPGHGS